MAEADGIDIVTRAMGGEAGEEEAGGAVDDGHGALPVVLPLFRPQEHGLEQVTPRVAVHGHDVLGVEVVLVRRVLAGGERPPGVPPVVVHARPAVPEVRHRRHVERHPRHDVVPVDHALERDRGRRVGGEEAGERGVADAGLAVGVDSGDAGHDVGLAVEREERRERGGERAAEAVARDDDAGVGVAPELVAEHVAELVVSEGPADEGGGGGGLAREGAGGVLGVHLLEAERLEEADMDVAHGGHAEPGEVDVGGPVLHVERLRATERHHDRRRVRGALRHHERLRRLRPDELCTTPAIAGDDQISTSSVSHIRV